MNASNFGLPAMYRILKKELLRQLEELAKLDAKKLVNKRMDKFSAMGVVKE